MNVYIYQAALLCGPCGTLERERLEAETGISRQLYETGVGSDGYPDGPHSNGGGEADSPQHCDHCGEFLDNPLTPDGRDYVRDALEAGTGRPDVLATWAAAYGESI